MVYFGILVVVELLVAYGDKNHCALRAGLLSRGTKNAHLLERVRDSAWKSAR